jgi:hypothetical protein
VLESNDYININNSLIEMHQGGSEIKFAQEKLANSIEKIQEEIKSGLQQSVEFFSENVKECQNYLRDYLQIQVIKQPQSSQITEDNLKSPNSKMIIAKIKQERKNSGDFTKISSNKRL